MKDTISCYQRIIFCIYIIPVVCFVLTGSVCAQPRYVFSQKTTTYPPLAGAKTISMAWDSIRAKPGASNPYTYIDIGRQTFTFFDIPFALGDTNKLGISANGNLKILNDTCGIIIDPFFTGLDSTNPDLRVSYKLEGISGNHILKIEWNRVGFLGCPATAFATFQIWLYQKTGIIEMYYGPGNRECDGIFWGNTGPFVGIFKGAPDFHVINEIVWLESDPASPTLVYNSLPVLTGAPAEGTLYTFTPSSLSTKGTFVREPLPPSDSIESYPDSVRDKLTFTAPGEGPVTVRILDIMGKLLRERTQQPDMRELDVHSLKAGTYLLELQTQSGRSIKRFTKL